VATRECRCVKLKPKERERGGKVPMGGQYKPIKEIPGKGRKNNRNSGT